MCVGVLLALSLQGCAGLGDLGGTNTNYHSVTKGKNGDVKINVEQALFKGKIYFTLDRNLYVLNGKDKEHPQQLTKGIDARDPAVSPNGKWIAFIIRYPNYSDLAYIPATGGKPTIIMSGYGSYSPGPSEFPVSSHHWFSQPAWDADNEHLIVLGDNQKQYWLNNEEYTGKYDSPVLDMQIYRVSMRDRLSTQAQIEAVQPVAYAAIGAGGLQDPSYRPGHKDQALYTSYTYMTSDNGDNQVVAQLNMVNVDTIANTLAANPFLYHPGQGDAESSPGVAITPEKDNLANLQPSFSPDGKSIIYVRREDATHMSLYTMPVVDGITSDPNNPAFDPKSAANTKQALSGYGKSIKLLTDQYVSHPLWSPDGTQIAYYNYSDTTFDLTLANIVKDSKTGTYSIAKDSQIQLTQANGSLDADSHPVWVP